MPSLILMSLSDHINNAASIVLFLVALYNTAVHLFGSTIMCLNRDKSQYRSDTYADSRCSNDNAHRFVPAILFLQCFMFYVPSFLWMWILSCHYAKLDFTYVINQSKELKHKTEVQRRPKIKSIVDHLTMRLNRSRRNCFLTCSYVIIKALYILNVYLQLVILHSFIGDHYSKWCWRVITGNGSYAEHLFPFGMNCEFSTLYGINNEFFSSDHSYYCHLPRNMTNQVTFLFIWIWLMLSLIMSTFSFMFLLYSLLVGKSSLLESWLIVEGEKELLEEKKAEVAFFRQNYLGLDGFLLLRFVQNNINPFVAKEIAGELFRRYQRNAIGRI